MTLETCVFAISAAFAHYLLVYIACIAKQFVLITVKMKFSSSGTSRCKSTFDRAEDRFQRKLLQLCLRNFAYFLH